MWITKIDVEARVCALRREATPVSNDWIRGRPILSTVFLFWWMQPIENGLADQDAPILTFVRDLLRGSGRPECYFGQLRTLTEKFPVANGIARIHPTQFCWALVSQNKRTSTR
jgi:hypothetical protein